MEQPEPQDNVNENLLIEELKVARKKKRARAPKKKGFEFVLTEAQTREDLQKRQISTPIKRDIDAIRALQDVGQFAFVKEKVKPRGKSKFETKKTINPFQDFGWLHGYKQTRITKVQGDYTMSSKPYESYFLFNSDYNRNGENWFLPSTNWWNDLNNYSSMHNQNKDIFSFVDSNKIELKFKIAYEFRNKTFTIQNEDLFAQQEKYLLLKYGSKDSIVEYYASRSISENTTFSRTLKSRLNSRLEVAINNLNTKFGIKIQNVGNIISTVQNINMNENEVVYDYIKNFFNFILFLDPKMEFGGFSFIFQKRFVAGYYSPQVLLDLSLNEKIPELMFSLSNKQINDFTDQFDSYLNLITVNFIYYIHNELDTTKKIQKFDLLGFKSSLLDQIKPYNFYCKGKENIPDEEVVLYSENDKLFCFALKDIHSLKVNPNTNVPFDEEFLIDLSHFDLKKDKITFQKAEKKAPINEVNEFMGLRFNSESKSNEEQEFLQKTIYDQISDELSMFKLEFSKRSYPYIQPIEKPVNIVKKQIGIAMGNKCNICSKKMKNPYKTVKLENGVMIKKYCSIDCFEKEEDWEKVKKKKKKKVKDIFEEEKDDEEEEKDEIQKKMEQDIEDDVEEFLEQEEEHERNEDEEEYEDEEDEEHEIDY